MGRCAGMQDEFAIIRLSLKNRVSIAYSMTG
jgi:hypothetical protein